MKKFAMVLMVLAMAGAAWGDENAEYKRKHRCIENNRMSAGEELIYEFKTFDDEYVLPRTGSDGRQYAGYSIVYKCLRDVFVDKPEPSRQCWEYEIKWFQRWGTEQLELFGDDGWEHYLTIGSGKKGYINYFKRPTPCKERK